MIRVVLPAHLRRLAQCEREVTVDSQATQRAVLDAVEQQYPMLRGTIRDPTGKRRAFVRFSPASRTCRTSRRTLYYPMRWRPGRSRS